MKVPVKSLKHHPLNQNIYSLTGIEDLIVSIQDVGLLQPLTIDQHNQVVSGNRRFEAIRKLKWEKVEVVKINVTKGQEIKLLIHFNKQRIKSSSELLKEYDHLKKYYKSNKNEIENGLNVRLMVAEDIKLSDSQLGRLIFIRKHRPELIDLIDKGILSINQSYLQCQRTIKEQESRNDIRKIESEGQLKKSKKFRFFQKSSNDMSELKDGEINLIFTSPPYFSARLYDSKKGLGNEKTPEEFIKNLSEHLDDCYRVLDDRGSFYLNLGDTFVDGSLQSIPHRVLIEIQRRKGWILRSTLVWVKSNTKPVSVKNTHTPSYEFIFHLVKGKDYHFEPVLTKLSGNTRPSHPPRHRTTKEVGDISKITPYIPNPLGKKLGDFLTEDIVRTSVSNQFNNDGIEHPAKFPIELSTIPIIQTCVLPFQNQKRKDITILDNFCGSLSVFKNIEEINKVYGTSLNFVGYDIKKYF
jgi:ParB-like chromosome segregation protein Spo0J